MVHKVQKALNDFCGFTTTQTQLLKILKKKKWGEGGEGNSELLFEVNRTTPSSGLQGLKIFNTNYC